MAMGSTPLGSFDVTINTEDAAGEQSFSRNPLTVPADWTELQAAFADMTPGENNTVMSTNGVGIISIVFSAHLVWVEDIEAGDGSYIPEPGPFELTIDDISFY
jgi:hypothetical protein